MQHVLICRTDNIGDVVLTLPLASYLRLTFPTLKIGFLCRRYAAALVRQCDAIDYVLESETLDGPLEHASTTLRDSGVDTIIFAKPDRRIGAAAKRAGVVNRIGTSHRLFHWMYCNRLAHFSRVKSPLHEAQINFALLRPLGIDVTPSLEGIVPLYRVQAPPLTTAIATLLGRSDSAVPHFNLMIHPKSNGNGREWPSDHFVALAQQLQAQPDIRLWITGSEGEGRWLEAHAPALLAQPNVMNLCGLLSLPELMAVIGVADGVVASGTGPLHVAAALGRRTLGLFPPLRPVHSGRWGPIGLQAQSLESTTPCSGCRDPGDCACMRRIAPATVAQVVLGWRDLARQQN
jgi:ADP-heptose:LPS heptosyltransferase